MHMRKTMAALVTILGFTLGAYADTPYDARIALPLVEVRSGPSLNYYATGQLKAGDHVRVVGPAETGWLSIVPPAGSFSWIPAQAINQNGPGAVVTAENVKVRMGSMLYKSEPTSQGPVVARGSQLAVIGDQVRFSDGNWYPIVPVPAEVRYIPANAIERPTASRQTEAPPLAATTRFNQPRFEAVRKSVTNDDLLNKAQQAEKEGRYHDAEVAYDQLKDQVKGTNYDLALKYLNKVQEMRDRERAADAGASQPAWAASRPAQGGTNGMLVNNTGGAAVAPSSPYPPTSQLAQASSQYCYQPDTGRTVRLTTPQVTNASPVTAPPPPAPTTGAPVALWYEPGQLYRTTLFINNKLAYRLVPLSGRDWMYVTAADNLNLEAYVNRVVALYGELSYHSTGRKYHLNVRQVSLQQ
jgi:uncharacterized protein YraI